ncbi:type IV secretion system protein [Gordonia rubripertincta]|uniref:type IV secretion system protein n=1 Tax=Gordonia rubripertincta TaxID=36822 RepID=UPI000B8D754F|nr:type IV secretion system protein [Gordonia rubripertincta]ASR05611.1 hypothetical protein GCWB2_24200 [Gordonia rubripertincta]
MRWAHLRMPAWTAFLTLVALVAALASAAPASADPSTAAGWMPNKPPRLTEEQQAWLEPMDTGDPDRKFLRISCSKHPEFADCAKHDPDEESKNVDAYIFNASDKSYAGVKAALPKQLAPEHQELLDANGVLDCAKAENKIPTCSNPAGKPAPANYDEQGMFVKLVEGGGQTQGETEYDLGATFNPATYSEKLLDNWFAQACETFGKFAGDFLVLSMTWWLKTDSINVTSGGVLAGERPVQLLVVMIVALGIISTAITMVLSRRPGPAAELGVGAFKFILICSMSGFIVAGALNAADDFSAQIVSDGAEEFGPTMKAMLGIAVLQNPAGVLTLGCLTTILGILQWLIGFARQAGLVVLFGMLIIAAAGQTSSWGRQWFPRIVATMIALILYKPMCATFYTIGFKLMGNEQSLSSVMVGLMTLGLCVIAMPALMAFFKWVSPGVGGGMGAATALAGAGAIGASLASNFSGGGSGGDSQSNYMDSTGPNSTSTAESDPSPGNSASGFGSGGDSGGDGGGEAASGATPEADLGGGDMGPGSESPDASGVPVAGTGGADPTAAAGAAEGGAAAGAAGGGAAAANPYVAAAMLAKEGLDTAAGAANDFASEATGESDTGPSMS